MLASQLMCLYELQEKSNAYFFFIYYFNHTKRLKTLVFKTSLLDIQP